MSEAPQYRSGVVKADEMGGVAGVLMVDGSYDQFLRC